ncbi:MAG: SLATT domain-containing protein, partial [Pseudomonadota bacterium]|nr:SLATT domain-containing protein [Pseudomonadota bacterium]
DKFFGFSSGWMRYMLTQLSLQKALAEFQLGWMLLWADIDKQQPTPEQRKKILQYLIDFQAKLFTEINQETQTWMIEFQSNLIQLERSTRTQAQLQRLLDSKKKVD